MLFNSHWSTTINRNYINKLSKKVFRLLGTNSKNFLNELAFGWARKKVKGINFTIVSNNCWGGHIYQALKIPYMTPFVGLFIPPDDYLRLIQCLEIRLNEKLSFVKKTRHLKIEEQYKKNKRDYPIGVLKDQIEVHFMHYSSVQEASEKWSRRLTRVEWGKSKVLYKFCDHDGATNKQIQTFDEMKNLNRVCFVGKRIPDTNQTVLIEKQVQGRVPDGGELAKISGRYFSAIDWICGGDAKGNHTWPRNVL